MKSNRFYNDSNAHYLIQNTALPFDSSLVKRKFLDIPFSTFSFTQKLDNYLRDKFIETFPLIAANYGGSYVGNSSSMTIVSEEIVVQENLFTEYQNQSSIDQAVVISYEPTHCIKLTELSKRNGFLPPPNLPHCGLYFPESHLLVDKFKKIP